MKKQFLIGLIVVLLALLFISPLGIPNEDPMLEGTEETTVPTDGSETINEYAGLDILEQIEVFDDLFWVLSPERWNKSRISVHIAGTLSSGDIQNAVPGYFDDLENDDRKVFCNIQTAEGEPLVRVADTLYLLDTDSAGRSLARKVASYWPAGSEEIGIGEWFMVDGDYVFTLEMELILIWVSYEEDYTDDTRSDQVEMFFPGVENATSVRLEVSSIESKEVRCFVITEDGETEVFPTEKFPTGIFSGRQSQNP